MDYKVDKQGRYYIDKRIAGKRCMLRAATKKDLDKKLRAWMDEQTVAKEDREKGPLYCDVSKQWWTDALQHIKPGTVHGYKAAKEYWEDHFRSARIKDIEPYDISVGLKRLSVMGYAKKTISNYRIVASRVFDYWVNELHGDKDPVSMAKMPKAKKSEVRLPPTDEQIEMVKSNTDGMGLLANLIMYTGMRLGEANGLQVKDIHLDKDCYGITGGIYVHQAAPWMGNAPYISTVKTDSGVRWIPIFKPIFELLKERISSLSEDDYLISGTDTPLTASQFKARWSDYCRSLGLAHPIEEKMRKNGKVYKRIRWSPDITPHQFRHYMATACYSAGVPELVAQRILGHSDINLTHKVYTHIRDRMMQDSAANLAQYFDT